MLIGFFCNKLYPIDENSCLDETEEAGTQKIFFQFPLNSLLVYFLVYVQSTFLIWCNLYPIIYSIMTNLLATLQAIFVKFPTYPKIEKLFYLLR